VTCLILLHASSSLVNPGEAPDPGDDADFAVSAYCRSMCKWGRGGNLCNCHAAYFAGKRSSGGRGGGRAPVAAGTGGDGHARARLAATRGPPTRFSAGRGDVDGESAEDDVGRHWWTSLLLSAGLGLGLEAHQKHFWVVYA